VSHRRAGMRRAAPIFLFEIGWPMPSNRDSKEFITTHEAAELLRCSVATVYRLIRRGEFPAERLGSNYRIWVLQFESWRTQGLRKYQTRKQPGA
jgi:excisionase family DNA binding protein